MEALEAKLAAAAREGEQSMRTIEVCCSSTLSMLLSEGTCDPYEQHLLLMLRVV